MALIQELAKKFMAGGLLRDIKSCQLISLRLLMFIKDSARSKDLPFRFVPVTLKEVFSISWLLFGK